MLSAYVRSVPGTGAITGGPSRFTRTAGRMLTKILGGSDFSGAGVRAVSARSRYAVIRSSATTTSSLLMRARSALRSRSESAAVRPGKRPSTIRMLEIRTCPFSLLVEVSPSSTTAPRTGLVLPIRRKATAIRARSSL